MSSVLLFNSKCSKCDSVARKIHQESNGKIEIASLYDPKIKATLDEIQPDWQWEPMLLETENGSASRVCSGKRLVFRLIRILGLSKAYSVWNMLHPMLSEPASISQHSRRSFLKNATGTAFASFGLFFGTKGFGQFGSKQIPSSITPDVDIPQLMQIISRTPEYRTGLPDFTTQIPATVLRSEGSIISIFNVHPKIPLNESRAVRLYPFMVFITKEKIVEGIYKSVPNYDTLEWEITNLRSSDSKNMVAFSSDTQKILNKYSLPSTPVVPDSVNTCYDCYCIEYEHVEGYLDGACFGACSIGCRISCSTGIGCAACMSICYGLCYYPAYDKCVQWDCGNYPCPQSDDV